MDHQTTQLWERLRRHGDEAVRNELVLAHLPLVRFVLGRLPITPPPGLDRDDLVGTGVIALLRAIEDFDHTRGLEFTTFAVPRIRGAMLDELRAHDVLPRSVRDRATLIERAAAQLRREGHGSPSVAEIAQHTGLPPDKVEHAMTAVRLRSFLSLEALHRTPRAGREERILEAAADGHTATPLANVLTKERDQILAAAITELPETERRVIVLYYQQNLMFKEIAEVLCVTKSRISQLHSRALFHLRTRLVGEAAEQPAAPVGSTA